MWTSPFSASATGSWRNDKPVPQLFCRCTACANNWPAVSFSVDKWPLVRQLSPGFSAGLGGIRKKSPVFGQTGPSGQTNRPNQRYGPQQAASLPQGAGPAKLALGAAKRPPMPSVPPPDTRAIAPTPETTAPPGQAQGARGSGCSSNVLSIHSGSSRAPPFLGISHFSLAESSAWLAGNPVPSTRAWPGANR